MVLGRGLQAAAVQATGIKIADQKAAFALAGALKAAGYKDIDLP